MGNKLFALVTAAGIAAAAYGFTVAPAPAYAGELKNLEIYPKDTTKKAIKKDMKKMAKALGVKCSYCHDMDDMAKDTDKKTVTRDMMKMTTRINKVELKKYKKKVTCDTCHRGKAEPEK